MSVSTRISALMEGRGWSQARLAREVGVSQPTIWKLVSGQATTSRHMRAIAKALETSEEYLLGETDNPDTVVKVAGAELMRPAEEIPENSVMLPQLEIGYSMGGGSVFGDYARSALVPFPREWLRPLIGGKFDDLFVARGDGDSMTPTLLDGDLVIVDTAQQTITKQDRLWCLSYGDLGMIKRVRMQPDGGALILSDNPAVADFTAYDEEVRTIGRGIWIGRRV